MTQIFRENYKSLHNTRMISVNSIQCWIFLYKQVLYIIDFSLSIWQWRISKAFKKFTLAFIRNSNLKSRAWENSSRNYEPHIVQWNGLPGKQRPILWWKQLFYRKGMSDQSNYFLHLWSMINFFVKFAQWPICVAIILFCEHFLYGFKKSLAIRVLMKFELFIHVSQVKIHFASIEICLSLINVCFYAWTCSWSKSTHKMI